MAYRYRANTDGTLSNPYRYVVKGEYVILPEPLKAKWLDEAPLDSDLPPFKELPVVPYLKEKKQTAYVVPNIAISDEYADNIKAIDNKISDDGKASELTKEKKSKKSGSGNQEVI